MASALGHFMIPSTTANAGTAFAAKVEPYAGYPGARLMYKLISGRPNWLAYGGAYTVLDSIAYADTGTAHSLVVMRPLNWAVVNGDVAHNATGVTLLTDPGAYTTSGSFKYPTTPESAGIPATVATNTIAGSDYIMVQLRDGSWHMSTVASVSSLTLTLTTATPNVSGGGIEDGSILFFFGVAADTNPNDGKAHLALTAGAGSTKIELVASGKSDVGIRSFFPGDPMILYSANASNAGTVTAAGHYSKE